MTTLQALHHHEQMEALRRDFLAWWDESMVPILREQQADLPTAVLSQLTHWSRWKKEKLGL